MTLKIIKTTLLLATVTGIAVGTAQICTASGVKAGPATIKISVENEHRFNDNLFLDVNKPKQDYINLTMPKAEFILPFGQKKHRLRMNYSGEAALFGKHHANDYYNQTAGGDIELKFGSIYTKAREKFSDTTVVSDTEDRSPTRIKYNRAGGTIGAKVAPFTYEFDVENILKRYDHEMNAVKEYDKYVYTGTGFFTIRPKLDLLCQYGYMDIAYPDDKDRKGFGHTVLAGLRGKLTDKIAAVIRAGYEYDKFATNEDYSAFVMNADIILKPFTSSRAILSYDKDMTESTYAGNNYVAYNRVSMQWTQQVTNKLSLTPSFSYQHDQYAANVTIGGITKLLQNNTFTPKIAAAYYFTKAFSLNAEYQYRTLLSNIDANEYRQNIISASLKYEI